MIKYGDGCIGEHSDYETGLVKNGAIALWTNPQQPQPQPQILYSQQIQQQPPIQQYEQQQTNWPNTQQMQHQQQQQQQPFLTQSLPQPLLTQQPPPITFQYHQPNSLQQQSHPQQQLQQQVLYQQIPAAIPSNTQSSIDEESALETMDLNATAMRVDKHERGERLLTINVELEKDCSQTIYVHVNDDPADLARDFCDLWKITNPEVVPALEDLIKEERSKILIVK
ncbi:2947_t:CDS:2 [Entrophospora sp. SA101]|nr:2947_t:CDS:2 [Entrophospora sp. SA101]